MKYKLSEVMDLIGGGTPKTTKPEYWDGDIPWLSVKDFNNDFRFVYETEKHITELGLNNSSTKLLKAGDVIISARGTVGEIATIPFPMAFNQSCYGLRAKKEIVTADFLYYLIKHNIHVLKKNTHGSVFDTITRDTFAGIEVDIPDMDSQTKIAEILSNIDEKIEVNVRINENLEQQLTALFIHDFADGIATASTDTCPMLGDLITVIDNRGKTPPLTTEIFDYPIIDVGALKGSGRIVDFNNCTKYVEQATYETWFRSGHPKAWDILISTVGSLAEMKIYLGAKGCMAQNVVALRATSISPLYLYQYLRFIRADLVAYNIGSVQPSIKVTHIVKHAIFVPEISKLQEFEEIARVITNRLYANYNECESLKKLRNTLLPKLMSGEIDVTDIQI